MSFRTVENAFHVVTMPRSYSKSQLKKPPNVASSFLRSSPNRKPACCIWITPKQLLRNLPKKKTTNQPTCKHIESRSQSHTLPSYHFRHRIETGPTFTGRVVVVVFENFRRRRCGWWRHCPRWQRHFRFSPPSQQRTQRDLGSVQRSPVRSRSIVSGFIVFFFRKGGTKEMQLQALGLSRSGACYVHQRRASGNARTVSAFFRNR